MQLLDADGDVVDSTVTSTSGHYSFDNLPAGMYSVRFAGIPEGSRLAPTGTGNDPATDSDPDYTGATPLFTLGVNERNVRDVTSADHVNAAYINPTIDAGITSLQFAVMDQVWLDVNGDGVQQVTEPGAGATVSLLSADGAVLARRGRPMPRASTPSPISSRAATESASKACRATGPSPCGAPARIEPWIPTSIPQPD